MLLPHHPGPWTSESLTPSPPALLLPGGEQLPGAAAAASRDFYVRSGKPDKPPPAVGPSASSSRAGAGGSVCRLPMHAEAVDAGVLGVAPVAQHPELHQLVRAHGITLGEREKEKPEP